MKHKDYKKEYMKDWRYKFWYCVLRPKFIVENFIFKLKMERVNKIEALAKYAHESWSGWMVYLFDKCVMNEDGSATLPKDSVDRWQRQMNTSYQELSENEKKSDRVEAHRILYVIEDRRD